MKLLLFLSFANLLIGLYALNDIEDVSPMCPPSHVICPCTCYVAGIISNLLCTSIYNQGIITRVVQESSKYNLGGFDLIESNITSIPSSLFSTQNPIKMNVLQSTLVSLFDKPPAAGNDLKIMILNGVTLSNGLQWEMFSEFKVMDFLTIMNTVVDKIDKSFVTYGPKKVGMLAFYKCSVSELDDYAFSALFDLTELYVQYGTINELKRSMFPTPNKLEKLDFKGHRIEQLPEDIFSDMPSLSGIDLSENVLAVFSETTFGPVYYNLHFVDVDENPIVCGCNIRWITTTISKYAVFRIDGICSDPEELKGRSLSDLKYEDFKNC